MSISQSRDEGFAFNYSAECPAGLWRGRLIAKSWGRRSNLVCYFDRIDTGEKLKLFLYTDGKGRYAPKDGKVDMSEPGIEGKEFIIETAINSKGNTVWVSAQPEDEEGAHK